MDNANIEQLVEELRDIVHAGEAAAPLMVEVTDPSTGQRMLLPYYVKPTPAQAANHPTAALIAQYPGARIGGIKNPNINWEDTGNIRLVFDSDEGVALYMDWDFEPGGARDIHFSNSMVLHIEEARESVGDPDGDELPF